MRISIIIPTYNRLAKLKRVLAGLVQQDCPPDKWELIVIDDGSDDGTVEYLENADFSFALKILRQEHQGPWPARSLGVEASEAEALLFLDDDIYPKPRLVSEHLKMLEADEPKLAGVRGHLLNWPEREQTPFLDYFDRHTAPAFFERKHGHKIQFNFVACANQSIKKDVFLSLGGFDPDFAGYGWADMELGLRLVKAGYWVRYNKNAAGYHDTSPTLESFCRRQVINGQAANLFYAKHPELRVKLITRRSRGVMRVYEYLEKHPLIVDINRKLIKKLEKLPLKPLLYLSYGLEIDYHYYRGMTRGMEEG